MISKSFHSLSIISVPFLAQRMTFLNQSPHLWKALCLPAVTLPAWAQFILFQPTLSNKCSLRKGLCSIPFPDANIHSESKLTKSADLSSFLWSSALSASCPHIPWTDWRTFPRHFWGSVLASLTTAFMANFFITLILNWTPSFIFFTAANFPCFTNEDYHFS